jgi:Fibronectin type III domain
MRRFVLVSIPLAMVFGSVFVSAPGASAASAPATVDPSSVSVVVQGLNVAVSWTDGDSSGVTGYVVSTVPQSPTETVPAGATSAVLTDLRPGISYTVEVAAQTASGTGDEIAAPSTVATTAPGGSFVGLTPARLLDTRIGLGAPEGATTLVALTVDGRGGVPGSGVSAVALNVTVTQPVGPGVVTAYPAGQPLPLASNLNYTQAGTVANFVVVPVGVGGVVDLWSSARTQLVADVSGYYTTVAGASPSAGLYHPLSPSRLMDTRIGTGGNELTPGGVIELPVTGQGPVPDSGVSAVVLNATVTEPTTSGFITVYPTGAARPSTSSVNFVAKQTVANRVIVPVGTNGEVSFYNPLGDTQLVVDVTGWYTDGTDSSAGGSYFVPVTPHRLIDTRIGTGAPTAQVGPGGVLPVQVAGQDGVPAANAQTPPTAAVLTVTMVNESASTFATVYPSLSEQPSTSDLNAVAHEVVPNLALPGLGVDGAVDVANALGSTDLVVDLSGYFIGDVHPPASTVTAAAGSITDVSSGASGPDSVTIAAGNPVPQVGQVIASAVTPSTPDGLLVQVTSTSTDSSGDTVAAVQPATLQQALGDSDIAISAPLDADDVVSTDAEPGVRTEAGGHGGVISASDLRARLAERPAADPIDASDTQPCSGDNTSSVTVSDGFNPTLVFEADLGHSGLLPTVSAKAGIDITESAGITVTFGGTVSCQWSAKLATYTFKPVEFDVAGVPVVIVPVFTLTMTGNAGGQAQMSASISQNFDAQAGIDYDHGSVNTYQSVTNTINHTGPTLTAADATASVSLDGDLEGKLYDVAGPEVSVTGTLTANADPQNTPWWTLGFTLTADAALHISVLFAHIDVSQGFTILSVTVAQASTGAASSPPVITTTALPDATTGTAYSTELTTADHRTGSWSISSGSLPAGLSLSGYTISGVPTKAGTSAFTLKFTDTAGHVVQAGATLRVDQGATGPSTGSLTGRVTDDQGHTLAGVEVELYDCNPFCGQYPVYDTPTSGNGTYTISSVTSGPDYVACFDGSNGTGGDSDVTGYVFTCFGETPGEPDSATDLTVGAGQTVSGIGAALLPGGAVSGQVTDAAGHPLGAGDAFVAALTSSYGLIIDPEPVPEAYIGANGDYLLKGLSQTYYGICFAGSDYPVSASFTGYGSNCYGNLPISAAMQNEIEVTVGETATGISGGIGEGSALSGTVTAADGNPLSGVQVTIIGVSGTNPAGYAYEITDAGTGSDGSYTVGNLTPGTNYQICFDGTNATGPDSAPYGYGEQCYNGVPDYTTATLVNEVAGQFVTGINGHLAVNTSPPTSDAHSDPASGGVHRAVGPPLRSPSISTATMR